jgi:putative methionine-R-sulfoxide reductase with GAF domain
MKLLFDEIRAIASDGGNREKRARNIAAGIKAHGQYRWVGVYDVRDGMVSIIAWSGPSAPAYPTFPITQGLTSAAISQKASVVVNDVTLDARYLTAFGSTRSEIIVPVIAADGEVVGTIDVESEFVGAFFPQDQETLEECARVALPLWIASKLREQ